MVRGEAVEQLGYSVVVILLEEVAGPLNAVVNVLGPVLYSRLPDAAKHLELKQIEKGGSEQWLTPHNTGGHDKKCHHGHSRGCGLAVSSTAPQVVDP